MEAPSSSIPFLAHLNTELVLRSLLTEEITDVNSQECDWLELSEEVVLQIFSNLKEARDLKSVDLTCRTWRRIVRDDCLYKSPWTHCFPDSSHYVHEKTAEEFFRLYRYDLQMQSALSNPHERVIKEFPSGTIFNVFSRENMLFAHLRVKDRDVLHAIDLSSGKDEEIDEEEVEENDFEGNCSFAIGPDGEFFRALDTYVTKWGFYNPNGDFCFQQRESNMSKFQVGDKILDFVVTDSHVLVQTTTGGIVIQDRNDYFNTTWKKVLVDEDICKFINNKICISNYVKDDCLQVLNLNLDTICEIKVPELKPEDKMVYDISESTLAFYVKKTKKTYIYSIYTGDKLAEIEHSNKIKKLKIWDQKLIGLEVLASESFVNIYHLANGKRVQRINIGRADRMHVVPGHIYLYNKNIIRDLDLTGNEGSSGCKFQERLRPVKRMRTDKFTRGAQIYKVAEEWRTWLEKVTNVEAKAEFKKIMTLIETFATSNESLVNLLEVPVDEVMATLKKLRIKYAPDRLNNREFSEICSEITKHLNMMITSFKSDQ